MAWAYAWAAQYISQEYVLTPNSARFLVMMLTPPTTDPGMAPQEAPPPFSSSAPLQARHLMERQIGAVEVIVQVWQRMMWGLTGLLALTALLAAATGWGRFFHLVAAAGILLSAIGTLVAMRLLISQSYGGMDPLPIRSHVYVGLGQSAYAWLLLLAFARRPAAERTA